jgi:hypothetical protein
MVTNPPPHSREFSSPNNVPLAERSRSQQPSPLHQHQHQHHRRLDPSPWHRSTRARRHDLWSRPDRTAHCDNLSGRSSNFWEGPKSPTDYRNFTSTTAPANANTLTNFAAQQPHTQPDGRYRGYRVPTDLESLNSNQMLYHLKKCQENEWHLHQILINSTDVDPNLDNDLLVIALQDENRSLRGRNAELIQSEKSLKSELIVANNRARDLVEHHDKLENKYTESRKELKKDNAELIGKVDRLLRRNVDLEKQTGINEARIRKLININGLGHQKNAQVQKEADNLKKKLATLEKQLVDGSETLTHLTNENSTMRGQLESKEDQLTKALADVEDIDIKFREKNAELHDTQNWLRTTQDVTQSILQRLGATLPYVQELTQLHNSMRMLVTMVPQHQHQITASETQSTCLAPREIEDVAKTSASDSVHMVTAMDYLADYIACEDTDNDSSHNQVETHLAAESYDSQRSPALHSSLPTGPRQNKELGSKRDASRSPEDKPRTKRILTVSTDVVGTQSPAKTIVSVAGAPVTSTHPQSSSFGQASRLGNAGRVVGPAAALHVSKVDVTTDVPPDAFIAYNCRALDPIDGRVYEKSSNILHVDVVQKVREQLAICKLRFRRMQ